MEIPEDTKKMTEAFVRVWALVGASAFVAVLLRYSTCHFRSSTLWLLAGTWLVAAVIIYGLGWLARRLANWREKSFFAAPIVAGIFAVIALGYCSLQVPLSRLASGLLVAWLVSAIFLCCMGWLGRWIVEKGRGK